MSLRAGRRVLAYYDEDDDLWHERLLLAEIRHPTWVVLTPHFDIYSEDLTDNMGLQVLGPKGSLPRNFRAKVLRFDESKLAVQKDALMEAGRILATEQRQKTPSEHPPCGGFHGPSSSGQ